MKSSASVFRLYVVGVVFFVAVIGLTQLGTCQTPPTPPAGFEWVKNQAFSDEFEGTELDRDKWHDHYPGWVGRPPGKFMPASVSVKDGCLAIKSGVLDPPDDRFTISCGAIQSKARDALYGYYECRMKASSISTSSTFWLNSEPKPIKDGSLSLELDIQECIGNAQRWPNFKNHMMSNTHIKFKPSAKGVESKVDKKGGNALLKSNVDEEFHTYGCWWIDANSMKFYADGEYRYTIEPPTDLDPTPFDRHMYLNVVCETYDWEVPPTAEDLNDDSRNTTYYDYVRGFSLVKIADAKSSSSVNNK